MFFDWGGTLAQDPEEFADPAQVWTHVLAEFGAHRDVGQIRSAINDADQAVGPLIYSYLGRTRLFWEIFDARVLDALAVTSQRPDVVRAVQQFFDDPVRIRLYPETRRTLVTLRSRGYRTGVISNHHDGLLRVLRHHELEPLLDTVTYSQEAGAEKPNPAVFALAVRRAQCEPVDAVHVGNDIDADVGGARRSGIAPIWINRGRVDQDLDCPTILTLDELLPVLESMR